MNFKNALALKISLFVVIFNWMAVDAAKADSIARPTRASSQAGLNYWFFKNLVIDVDHDLKELGINAASCIYHSDLTHKEISYKGLGSCLFASMLESIQIEGIPGTTYFWLVGTGKNASPVAVRWRPPHGGVKTILKEAFEMTYEQELYWLRNKVGHQDSAESIHYKEFIAGSWDIIFPDDPEVFNKLIADNNPVLGRTLKGLRKLTLAIQPTSRENGLVVEAGQVTAELHSQKSSLVEGSPSDSATTLVFSVRSNLNILFSRRPFFLKIKSEIAPLIFKDLVEDDHAS